MKRTNDVVVGAVPLGERGGARGGPPALRAQGLPGRAGRVGDRGVQRGDRVATVAHNHPDTVLAYFYAWARVLRIVDGPDAVHRRTVARMEMRKTPAYVG